METMTIGEVARRTQVRASTLRYYEQVGLLPAPQRIRGRRVYTSAVLHQISLIRQAQRAGFTLAEIQTLLHPASQTPSARWQDLAHHKLAEIAAWHTRLDDMQRVLERGLACRCTDLNTCQLVCVD